MNPPEAHHILRKSDGGELLIAVDYAAGARTVATFTELVALLRTEHTIWETAPPPYGAEAGMTGADHVDRWARDIAATDRPVRAVLGFCAGSTFAAALVRRIATDRPRPRLLLFDPEPPRRHMLVDDVSRQFRVRLAAVLTPAEVAAAVTAVDEADRTQPDPLALAARLGEVLREVATPAMARLGLTVGRNAEFIDLFVSYLHWLAAGSQLPGEAAWAGATVLSSATDGFGPQRFDADRCAALGIEVRHFDVRHDDLMRSPPVVDAVAELLRSAGGDA